MQHAFEDVGKVREVAAGLGHQQCVAAKTETREGRGRSGKKGQREGKGRERGEKQKGGRDGIYN